MLGQVLVECLGHQCTLVLQVDNRASNEGSQVFHNHKKGPFLWLKMPASALTFKTLLRHMLNRRKTMVRS